MNGDKIQKAVIFAIERLKEDYENNLLCHEGSLQSALYMHLRNKLKFGKNEKIWCELRLKTQVSGKQEDEKEIINEQVINEQVAVDMGMVTINKDSGFHLKNRITKVHTLIEIKYVQMSAKAKEQFKDRLSGEESKGIKIVETLYWDITKLHKLRGSCMNMNNEKLIEESIPDVYFIACIEDSKTYEEEFMIIKNGEFISQSN